ncbi:MAG: hypothetical protein ACR2M7_02505 [Bdellovibrionales bacterium]
MRDLELVKGKGNGARKAYRHALETNLFGVADKIKAARQNPNKRKFNKKRK